MKFKRTNFLQILHSIVRIAVNEHLFILNRFKYDLISMIKILLYDRLF